MKWKNTFVYHFLNCLICLAGIVLISASLFALVQVRSFSSCLVFSVTFFMTLAGRRLNILKSGGGLNLDASRHA